jgi:copper chaperone CopZ
MYKSEYQISGMTCQGCVNSIKKQFSTDNRIISSEIDLNSSNLNLESTVDLKPGDLNAIIGDLKKYNVSYKTNSSISTSDKDQNSSGNMKERKKFTPLIISLLLITLLALVPQIRDGFNVEGFMKSLMGYFFVIFSLFKLLNIKGFADSFSNYDLLASKVPSYGTIYPFIELTLGICFLANFGLLYVNVLTFIIMSVGSIGIGKSLKNKDQLECACLGASFSLPLTPVTLIENLTMAAMALYMITKLV